MKKIAFLAAFLICCTAAFAQKISLKEGEKPYTTAYSQPQPGVHQVLFTVNEFSADVVETAGVSYEKIQFASSAVTQDKGWAELPFISASVQLPGDKDVSLEVKDASWIEYTLDYPLLPSRGVIYRNQNPSEIPYEIAEESLVDAFYPEKLATMEEPFIIRDVRGTTVRVFPFQYNPVTRTLRVCTSVVVELREKSTPATNPLSRPHTAPVKGAIGMYQNIFLNYEPSRTDLAAAENGDILVLTTTGFQNGIDPYIQWKREMGYNVEKQIVTNGANVVSTIQAAYNANPNLMYVQLVGDWANIKSNTISTSDSHDCPADPHMGCVSGTDNYPDIAIGRFSCNTVDQLLVQVNKAINYEKNPNMDSGWRETFIGIGSAEGSGSGDDGEIDYTHIQRIYTERLQGFTYNTHQQNYGSNASATTLAGHVNQGASTIAYCGHGAETYFVTTNYSNSNVNASTNGDRLPFIVAVACVNGAFHNSTDCFAEAWLKKENGGAVVTLMSTINQPWTPPQRGQDYFYDILTGGFDYSQYSGQNGLSTHEQRTRWGSIVVNAFNLSLQESSTSSDIETFKTWTTFGDASLQLRTKQPDIIAISNETVMQGIPFTAVVTANGTPVADALVCISQNGNYFHAFTDADGNVTIDHELEVGEVLLVVTAFNTTTLYENIDCVAGNVPYLALDSYTPQTISHSVPQALSMTFVNRGSVATASPTTVTISCDDPYLTIQDATESIATMAGDGGTATANNGFVVIASGDIETGHIFRLGYTATCDSNTWSGTFALTGIGSDCDAPTGLQATANGNAVTLTWDDNTTIETISLTDDAEGHTSFTINSPGSLGWSYIDGDGANTGTFNGLSYSNAGSPMAFIVLDMAQATGSGRISANSGDKFFACPYANGGWYNTVQNDDWMISPELNFTSPITFSFYARSYSSQYSTERFHVAYSTSGTNASDFTNITSNPVTTTTTWTQYTYTIPAIAKYVAIHCISNDQYIFCVDDIAISGDAMNGHTYNIYRNGELIASEVVGGTFTDSNLEDGTYCYTITSNCQPGFESLVSGSSCATVGTPSSEDCGTPANLTATPVATQITLAWDAVEGAIAYRVYRDGQPIATTPNTTHTDATVEEGHIYAYAVQSICMGAESEVSGTVEGHVGICQYAGNQVNIYPNPTYDKVIVNAKNIAEIAVFDLNGHTVATLRDLPDNAVVDLTPFAAGIYTFRIIADGNVAVAKVVKRN